MRIKCYSSEREILEFLDRKILEKIKLKKEVVYSSLRLPNFLSSFSRTGCGAFYDNEIYLMAGIFFPGSPIDRNNTFQTLPYDLFLKEIMSDGKKKKKKVMG